MIAVVRMRGEQIGLGEPMLHMSYITAAPGDRVVETKVAAHFRHRMAR
jgi:hypothetical protein